MLIDYSLTEVLLMRWIRNSFAFDLRSIALFRILLGTLILIDLALRSVDINTFYTDSGVLPRHQWLDVIHRWYWSVHGASGELWWQLLLFFLAAVLALGLIVGYRSKLMAGGSFLLLVSLLNRNDLLLQGGDLLLVVMCFWSLFLPLGARYSVDAALRREHQATPNLATSGDTAANTYLSVATFAITLQILYLYFFTAVLKSGDAWTSRFDAAFYAVSLQHFVTPIGEWFRNFPGLLKLATGYVLSVEFIAPFLVLCPILWPRIRLIGLVLLASLHLAFLMMLHIGLFPLIDFMALSLLVPGSVWDWLRRRSVHTRQIVMHYDEDCGFCLKMCLILRSFLLPPQVIIQPAQHTAAIHDIMQRENSWVVTDASGKTYTHWYAMAFLFRQRWPFKPLGWLFSIPPFLQIGNLIYRWVANNRSFMGAVSAKVLPYRTLKLKPTFIGALVAAVFFYVVTAFNIYELPAVKGAMPVHVERIARHFRINQRWDMFAPYPSTQSIYPIISGELRDGTVVDLYPYTSASDDWQAPQRMYELYPSYRWRKYLGRVKSHSNNTVRESLGSYYCRSWNDAGPPRPKQLATLEIKFVVAETRTDEQPKVSREQLVWSHWCYAEFANKSG